MPTDESSSFFSPWMWQHYVVDSDEGQQGAWLDLSGHTVIKSPGGGNAFALYFINFKVNLLNGLTAFFFPNRPSPTERQLIPVAFVSEKWFEISCWRAIGFHSFSGKDFMNPCSGGYFSMLPPLETAKWASAASFPCGNAAPLWELRGTWHMFICDIIVDFPNFLCVRIRVWETQHIAAFQKWDNC